MKKKIAAFFDIDGTIYREGLITEVFKKLITYEIIDENEWLTNVGPAYKRWDDRQGDYDTYLEKMVESFKTALNGTSKEYIEYIAKRVVEQKGNRVYMFTRNEILKHQKAGHLVIAISGSPSELVNEMAKKYKFDDYRGTIYHTDKNGQYTGKITPMWDGESKEKTMLELAEEYNIDLDKSFAYGDTNGDLTMFKRVGNPFAINPTKELLGNIKKDKKIKEKIQVIVERKDVIYNIDLDHVKLK